MKHHLAVIAILGKAIVVAVLHLSVVVADLLRVKAGLHLGVMAARLHLELLGVIEAGVPDEVEVADVDLHLILVVGEVVLSIPEVPISVRLELGGMVIALFFMKDITISNDTMVTSIPWRSLRHCRRQRWRLLGRNRVGNWRWWNHEP